MELFYTSIVSIYTIDGQVLLTEYELYNENNIIVTKYAHNNYVLCT